MQFHYGQRTSSPLAAGLADIIAFVSIKVIIYDHRLKRFR